MGIVDDSKFVVIWQQARSLAEAAQLAGYRTKRATAIASARAARLREVGVPLRRFKGVGRAAGLKRLIWLAKRARADVAQGQP